MTDHDGIWITSTRAIGGDPPACLITWDGLDKYAGVAEVRQTAEDLMTCAAYADLISELLTLGLDGHHIMAMFQSILKRRDRPWFGSKDTLFALPAGSSQRKQGVVLVARRNLFHQGKSDFGLLPDEARAMARKWLEAAEATESDGLFDRVLRKSWLSGDELDTVFGLLHAIRADETSSDGSSS